MPRLNEILNETSSFFSSLAENKKDCEWLALEEGKRHLFEYDGIVCLARTKTGKMTDKRRKIRLTESVSCAG